MHQGEGTFWAGILFLWLSENNAYFFVHTNIWASHMETRISTSRQHGFITWRDALHHEGDDECIEIEWVRNELQKTEKILCMCWGLALIQSIFFPMTLALVYFFHTDSLTQACFSVRNDMHCIFLVTLSLIIFRDRFSWTDVKCESDDDEEN